MGRPWRPLALQRRSDGHCRSRIPPCEVLARTCYTGLDISDLPRPVGQTLNFVRTVASSVSRRRNNLSRTLQSAEQGHPPSRPATAAQPSTKCCLDGRAYLGHDLRASIYFGYQTHTSPNVDVPRYLAVPARLAVSGKMERSAEKFYG